MKQSIRKLYDIFLHVALAVVALFTVLHAALPFVALLQPEKEPLLQHRHK